MADIEAAHVSQFDPLQVRPKALTRIQLWGIGRQVFQVEPPRHGSGTRGWRGCGAWRPLPDENHAAWDFAQQMLQKSHHVFRVDRLVLAVEIPLALKGYGADDGGMIAAPPLPQDGRVAYERTGADLTGEGIGLGFVEKEEASPLGLRLLLMAGHAF
jgi:hypothetical protein